MYAGAHAVTTDVFPQWNQELLFEILDKIHDVVLVIDAETTIVYANEAYSRILGVPVAKVLGRRLDKIEPESATIKTMHSGVPSRGQSYLYSVGMDVVGNSFPLYQGGKILGCVSIFQNITEVVKLSRELQRTQGVADYLKEQLDQREQLPLSCKDYIPLCERKDDMVTPANKFLDQHAKERPYDVKDTVARVEKEMILSALAAYNNNRSNAMKALGISRRAFYDKLRRYGIDNWKGIGNGHATKPQ